MTTEVKPLTRSEREAQLKDKAGFVIVFIALLLAVTTYMANSFSGKALTRLLETTDTYGFYQAKSIKGSIAEGQLEDAIARKDEKRAAELRAKIARYESDEKSGEGKKELLAKAIQLKAEREEAKAHGPWLTFAGMLFQLAIVLLSASILAVDKRMYWGSIGVSLFGILLLTQGIWLWAPITI